MQVTTEQNAVALLRKLYETVVQHSHNLNEEELPPDGASYNELHDLVTDELGSFLRSTGWLSDPVDEHAVQLSDEEKNMQEGWLLAEIGPGLMQIQRYDDTDIFANDSQAREFVINKAGLRGADWRHVRALEQHQADEVAVAQWQKEVKNAPQIGAVSAVLVSILNRISLSSSRELLSGLERCAREQLNGNANSQHNAANEFSAIALQAVQRMLDSDRQYVATLLATPGGA